jgi:TRAP-type mannitol/chloroaromatic compound transport system permease small subunit
MLWVSWPSIVNSWSILEMSPDPGGLPRYPIKSVLLVAFVLLLLQGVAEGIRSIAILRGDVPPAGDRPTSDSSSSSSDTSHEDDRNRWEGV